jgi:hypothetical protein
MKHKKLKVYLAGQWNEYLNNWKDSFKKIDEFDFYDPEVDSDQNHVDKYFVDDLRGVRKADIMVANPGIIVSEGTWIEIGYFYALNTKKLGDFCHKLIIIWDKKRKPKWSLDFIKKMGIVVDSKNKAIKELLKIKK